MSTDQIEMSVRFIEGHLDRIAHALEGLVEVLADRAVQIEFKPGSELERISDSLDVVAKVMNDGNVNVRALLLADEEPIKVALPAATDKEGMIHVCVHPDVNLEAHHVVLDKHVRVATDLDADEMWERNA